MFLATLTFKLRRNQKGWKEWKINLLLLKTSPGFVNRRKEVNDLLQKQEIMWRQRSRVDWLKEGDLNTSFFHGRASMRKRKNKISKLKSSSGDGCMIKRK